LKEDYYKIGMESSFSPEGGEVLLDGKGFLVRGGEIDHSLDFSREIVSGLGSGR